MIEQHRIDAIKDNTNIVDLIRSRGITLKKKGNGYKGLCPFHNDKETPSLSITPSKNIFKCFGCGKAGDPIKFVQFMDQVDFPTAVATLEEQDGALPKPKPDPLPSELPPEKARQLLDRVIAVYSNNLESVNIAKQYLEERGILDFGLLSNHCAGFSCGSLIDILPSQGEIRQDLTTIGIIDKLGRERFIGCIVFPVYDLEGKVITLYGRHIKDKNKRHLFLPSRPTGLWNIKSIKYYEVIILVESIIDALSVMLAGFPNVAAIQGTNGLTDDHLKQLKEYGVKAITLLMDGDEPGQNSCLRLKEKMADFKVREVTLPDKHDPNSYLVAHGAESLANFIRTAPDTSKKVSSLTAAKTEQIQRSGDGFTFTYGLRHYHIMGIDKGRRKLKATIRLEHGGKLHVDTIDFYSARARRTLAQDICRIFDEIPETIEADITRLMTACEQASEEDRENNPQAEIIEISAQEKKEAEAFGKSADLIPAILADFETCGLIGEESNKLLGYLAMTSRKLDKPLSMLILSSSGAGKSALQDAITGFCPPEDLIKITSLSGKALFYKDQHSLKNKVLAIEEGDGADDAAYAIRSLISNGVLISESTIKDLGTGRLTTMESRVEGPTSVFFTTTKPNTDPETASRFFVTGIDESREQTRKILAFQRRQQMVDNASNNSRAEPIRNLHRNFQRLLQPVGVRNPYGDKLAYEDDRLQGRRDQPKYLQLIKTIAFLRQMQKKVMEGGYVKVDKEDIRIANYLANELMGKSLDELSRPGRDLLMLLDQMVEQMVAELDEEAVNRAATPFTRRQVREFSGWSNYRVHTHIKELIELEYVLIDSGRNGVSYRYRLAYEGQGKAGDMFMIGLTDVEDLKEK